MIRQTHVYTDQSGKDKILATLVNLQAQVKVFQAIPRRALMTVSRIASLPLPTESSLFGSHCSAVWTIILIDATRAILMQVCSYAEK